MDVDDQRVLAFGIYLVLLSKTTNSSPLNMNHDSDFKNLLKPMIRCICKFWELCSGPFPDGELTDRPGFETGLEQNN